MAALFEAQLKAAGVVPLLSAGKNPTGVCVILKRPDGQNIIRAAPGASTEFRLRDLPPELIRNAGVVVLDGYMLPREDLVEALLAEARAAGVPAAIDSSSAFIVRETGKRLLEYARTFPLLLFMNEEEAAALSALNGLSLEALSAKGPFPIITVKKEERGAAVYAGGTIIEAEARPLVPVESTGAGDAFCGAFLSAWLQKQPLARCAALANEAAALVLSVPGTALEGAPRLREQFTALKEKYLGI
jgi:sugar/nucleoside kinase (ribokinase family)